MSGLKVTFHGAAGTVTGSKTLLEDSKRSILVDCGLFQGPKELRLRNWAEPTFDPLSLDAIVLTHAHIDHTGYLPLVVKKGYRGPIFCTPATKELLGLLLPDAAYLQEEQARFQNRHGTSKHHPAKPLFTEEDAEQALSQIEIIQSHKRNEILSDLFVTTTCAGHILGSNSLFIEMGGRSVSFSGDIGRYDMPILPDPEGMQLGDLLVCESTYGNRLHDKTDPEMEIEEAVKLAVKRGGTLLVPSFAIGRTQLLLYYLAKLERDKRIPVLPVRVDSPMALDATIIYRKFKFDFDEDSQDIIKSGEPVLLTKSIKFCRTVDESKALNELKGPSIIISASGMATGGRILHHLTRLLPKPDTTVLLVGYQAEGTRGRSIQEGADSVKIFGRHVENNAHLHQISTLSAHGDKEEMIKWLKQGSGKPGLVRINHGESNSSQAFSNTLQQEFGWDAAPARHLERIEL